MIGFNLAGYYNFRRQLMKSNTRGMLWLYCARKRLIILRGCLNTEFRGLADMVDYTRFHGRAGSVVSKATGQLWSGPDLPLIP